MSYRDLLASLALAVLIGAALPCPVACAQGSASAALSAPDVLVKTMSEDVLASIRKDPSLQSGDISRLNALVDEKVLPYVNFEKMTRLAVGRGWRDATAEQRQVLTRESRTLLVRTYAGAVSSAKDYQVQMRPFRAEPTETDVLVVVWQYRRRSGRAGQDDPQTAPTRSRTALCLWSGPLRL